MSDAMRDDYFSFMSNRSVSQSARELQRGPGKPAKPVKPAKLAKSAQPAINPDTIDFVDESHIEVTESFVSDTAIQRLFRRRSDG